MPYEVRNTGKGVKPFCVFKADDASNAKPLGCHSTKKQAQGQMAALYANEKEEAVKAATDADKKAQEARAKACGIAPKDGGNVTKPSQYKNIPDGKFLDACVTGDTLIVTNPHGPIPISQAQVGMKVYGMVGGVLPFGEPGKHGPQKKRFQAELAPLEIVGVKETGIFPIYEVRTGHSVIRGTAEHPILLCKRDLAGGGRRTTWARLDTVKPGDYAIAVKRLPCRTTEQTYGIDHMRLLGFFVGDGWVCRDNRMTNGVDVVELACANETEAWKYAALLAKAYPECANRVKVNPHHQEGNQSWDVRLSSTNVAGQIDALGFGHGAHNKHIPSWVFELSEPEIRAFIEGYIEADGNTPRPGQHYIISVSKQLLEQLKILALHIGWWSSNIYARIIRESSNGFKGGAAFQVVLYSNYSPRGHIYDGREIFLPNEKTFVADKVRRVTIQEPEPVYDIMLNSGHNFVANGFIAHNTNYAYPADAEHIVPALVYFNRAGQREAGGYSTEEWAIMGKKLASLMDGKVYKDGNVVDKAAKEFTGFKAVGDKWWGLWSNAFQDRDKETFATDSIQEFTDWWWKEQPDTPLWFWHVPFAMGTVELVGGVGRFAIAAGTLNETGQKTTEYYEDHPEQRLAMSHMYLWSPDRKSKDGVYSWFRTKEITFLPALKAANEYTLFGEVKMELSVEKKAKLTEILGETEAEMVISAALSATKELEEAGVAYKQVSSDTLDTLQGLVDGLTDEKEKAKFQGVIDELVAEAGKEKASGEAQKDEPDMAARFQALVDEVADPELKARLAAGVAQAMNSVAEVEAPVAEEAVEAKAAEEAPVEEQRLVLDDAVISELATKITDLLGKPDVESIRAEVAQMRKELAESQAKINEVAKTDELKMKELLAKQPKALVHRASRAPENVATEVKEAATAVDPMGLSLKESIAKINEARNQRAAGR